MPDARSDTGSDAPFDASALPPRPTPTSGTLTALAGWLAWFGVGRLVLAALSMMIVVAGAVWLLRAPSPTTEAGLPMASSTTVAVTSAPGATTASAPLAEGGESSGDATSSTITVHVAGHVPDPGVHELSTGARVADAIEAAGGFGTRADPDGLNLARALTDGERVYVPEVGEIDPAAVPSGGTPNSDEAEANGRPIDLNEATATELESLPGVGPATATAIVDDRARNGPFASVDDLERVPGIGPAKLASLAGLVTV